MAETIRAFASFRSISRGCRTCTVSNETWCRELLRIYQQHRPELHPRFSTCHCRQSSQQKQMRKSDDIPDDICQTTHGEEFLALHVFATDKNLDILVSQRHWFCDRTFDSTPNGYQLHTLYVIADGSRTVPVVYCITRRKDQNIYDHIFQFLKDH